MCTWVSLNTELMFFKYWEATCRETLLLLTMKWNGFLSMGFLGGLPPLGAEDSLGLLRRVEISSGGGGGHLLLIQPAFQEEGRFSAGASLHVNFPAGNKL